MSKSVAAGSKSRERVCGLRRAALCSEHAVERRKLRVAGAVRSCCTCCWLPAERGSNGDSPDACMHDMHFRSQFAAIVLFARFDLVEFSTG